MYVHAYVQWLQYLCSSFIYTHSYYIHIIYNIICLGYDIPEKLKLATCVLHTTYHIGHQPTSYLHQIPIVQNIMEAHTLAR